MGAIAVRKAGRQATSTPAVWPTASRRSRSTSARRIPAGRAACSRARRDRAPRPVVLDRSRGAHHPSHLGAPQQWDAPMPRRHRHPRPRRRRARRRAGLPTTAALRHRRRRRPSWPARSCPPMTAPAPSGAPNTEPAGARLRSLSAVSRRCSTRPASPTAGRCRQRSARRTAQLLLRVYRSTPIETARGAATVKILRWTRCAARPPDPQDHQRRDARRLLTGGDHIESPRTTGHVGSARSSAPSWSTPTPPARSSRPRSRCPT